MDTYGGESMSILSYKNPETGEWLPIPQIQGERGPQGPAGPQGETGDSGATFTPTVSEDGTLSWTNDKGLENPAAVNIMGPQGPAGEDGSEKEWELFQEIVVEEEVTYLDIGHVATNQDTNELGAKKYREALMLVSFVAPTSGAISAVHMSVNNNSGGKNCNLPNMVSTSGTSSFILHIKRLGSGYSEVIAGQGGAYAEKYAISYCPVKSGDITQVPHIMHMRLAQPIGTGTTISIYGR